MTTAVAAAPVTSRGRRRGRRPDGTTWSYTARAPAATWSGASAVTAAGPAWPRAGSVVRRRLGQGGDVSGGDEGAVGGADGVGQAAHVEGHHGPTGCGRLGRDHAEPLPSARDDHEPSPGVVGGQRLRGQRTQEPHISARLRRQRLEGGPLVAVAGELEGVTGGGDGPDGQVEPLLGNEAAHTQDGSISGRRARRWQLGAAERHGGHTGLDPGHVPAPHGQVRAHRLDGIGPAQHPARQQAHRPSGQRGVGAEDVDHHRHAGEPTGEDGHQARRHPPEGVDDVGLLRLSGEGHQVAEQERWQQQGGEPAGPPVHGPGVGEHLEAARCVAEPDDVDRSQPVVGGQARGRGAQHPHLGPGRDQGPAVVGHERGVVVAVVAGEPLRADQHPPRGGHAGAPRIRPR